VADASHQALAIRLGADWSALTNGHHSRLWHYEKAFRAQTEAAAQQSAGQLATSAPQQQLDTLRAQLAEMQKTLTALEQAITNPPKDAPPADADKK
jgi:hypothetical protein